jgi:DNA-binding transcriptional MerR regulator
LAYTTRMVAALSGATVGQLRHWRGDRTGPLLAPEIAGRPQAFYSFRDLLALGTFVHLREHASLRKIRVGVGNLRDLGEVEHLASYRLIADIAGNIQLVTHQEAVDLVRQPGQLQVLVVMGDVIEAWVGACWRDVGRTVHQSVWLWRLELDPA